MVWLELVFRVYLGDEWLNAEQADHENHSDVKKDDIDAHTPKKAARDDTWKKPSSC